MNNRESNYEIMKHQMKKEFLKYDQEKMIRKFSLSSDEEFIYIRFFSHNYRIDRKDGSVWRSEDGFRYENEADYNETMTIYDVLCYSSDDCSPANDYVNMKSMSEIKGGSMALGTGFFAKTEKLFDHKDEMLSAACEKLNGIRTGKGDVAYQIPMFDFLNCQIQFWNSDEEFDASLQIFLDKHMQQYMHYETMYFAVGHLLKRLSEEFY